jgi:hypothetical protein
MSDQHPSYYALDGARLGRPLDAGAGTHVASCPACAAHLRLAADRPPWLDELATAPRPPSPRRRAVVAVLAAAGMAAVGLLSLRPRPTARGKGGPGVTVFVKRGDELFPWEPGRRLQPQDRLRLRLAPAGYAHVSVASLRRDRAPLILFRGPTGGRPALLPPSFRVDDQPGEERLSVVLGHAPVADAEHARAGAGETWRQTFTLEKEPSPGRGP